MAYIGPGITIEGGVTLTTLPQFYDASAGFDGWDLSGAGAGAPSLDAVTGNAAPSFKLTLSNQYMRRNLGTKFLNKTIQFDIKLGYTGTGSAGSGADTLFLFAQNTAGNSAYRGVLRMWQSNVGVTVTQGLTTTDNAGWLYAGLSAGGETSRLFAGETWYTVKIQITSGGVVTWYINNALQTSTITLPAGYATADENYNWFGIVSNNYGGTANYDNLYIWDGIV